MQVICAAFFAAGVFNPPGYDDLRMPMLGSLHAVADVLIALAYYAMSALFVVCVCKRRDLPFHPLYLVVGGALIVCGTTHMAAVWTLWYPTYWLVGGLKVVTAALLMVMNGLLMHFIPKILALPSPVQLAQVSSQLRAQVHQRQHVETALRQAHEALARDGEERAAALAKANASLEAEVAERKGVEEALPAAVAEAIHTDRRRSGAIIGRQSLLFENLTDGVMILDDEGRIIDWNAAAERIFGYSKTEILGQMPTMLYSAEVGPHTAKDIHRAFAQGEHWSGETSCLRQDGGQRTCETVIVPVQGAQGLFIARLVVNRDISERKQVEQALRDSEQLYRSMFENNPLPMWAYDLETLAFLDVNDAAIDRYGYTRDEFLAMTIKDIRPPADVPALMENIAQLDSDFDAPDFWRHLKKDGSIIDVEVTSHAISLTGRAARLVLAQDVTSRLQIEAEIRRLNEELERRVDERTAQWAATNHELESFSYSVSHDLRAPLRSIDGFSLALMEDDHDHLTSQGQDYLRRIRSATQRMSELIDALLVLSRVARIEVQYEVLDLSRMALTITDELRRQDPSRDVQWVIAPHLPTKGDPRLLRIVLDNLLGNAWKFTSKRDAANIEFGGQLLADGTPVFFVRDNGAGFDMAYADKLFGAFQRLHRMDDFPGTGIGLATVQRIIHRHSGRVWAKGGIDQGATFYFTL